MLRKIRLQHIKRWPPTWKVFLPTCCCKNESEIGFPAVTSSSGYQNGFSADASQFLSTAAPFYDFAANNFTNFLKLSRQWNNISFNSNLTQASSLKFWHWEWWVFRFPIWAYQDPSTWFIFGCKLETCSSAGSKPSATTRSEALADLVHVFQLHSNANNNEGVLVLSWIKRVRIFQNKKVVHLFTHSSATFLYQTNQWHIRDGKFFFVS